MEKQTATKADIVLGLFPANNPQKMDMVKFDDNGKIKNLVIKPKTTDLIFTWVIAVWNPNFTNFLNSYLNDKDHFQSLRKEENDTSNELYIGNIIIESIKYGLKIDYIKYENGLYIDIGTPSQLKKVNDIDWIKEINANK